MTAADWTDAGLNERAAALARDLVAGAGVAGAAVGVTAKRSSISATAGRSGNHAVLDGRARFEIGSLTKLFTALVLADMVCRAEVGLDTRLAELLPGHVRDPGGQVTLAALASHTSGLPRLPVDPLLSSRIRAGDPDPYRVLGRQWLKEAVRATPLGAATSVPAYSNLGFWLLGEALAEASGLPWADLVQCRVLDVLAMSGTSVRPDALTVAGHGDSGDLTPYWSMQLLPAAGALYSNVEDLLRFTAACLDPGSTPLGEAVSLCLTARADGVGLGWMLTGNGVAWHNGGTGGFGSYLAIRPGRGDGVVALTNCSYREAVGRACAALLP